MTSRRLDKLPVTERCFHMETRVVKVLKNRSHARRLGHDRLRVTEEAQVGHTRLDPTATTSTESVAIDQSSIRAHSDYGEECLLKALALFERADVAFENALSKADNRRPISDTVKEDKYGNWFWEGTNGHKYYVERASDDEVHNARLSAAVRLLRDMGLEVSVEQLRTIASKIDRRKGARYSA